MWAGFLQRCTKSEWKNWLSAEKQESFLSTMQPHTEPRSAGTKKEQALSEGEIAAKIIYPGLMMDRGRISAILVAWACRGERSFSPAAQLPEYHRQNRKNPLEQSDCDSKKNNRKSPQKQKCSFFGYFFPERRSVIHFEKVLWRLDFLIRRIILYLSN